MRKITINLAAVAAFCIVVASPALVSSSCATPKTEQEDTTIIREDSGITALKYSSPEVPSSIEFCGKVIDLSRFDRHERMDRELLAFTYMHSTSLQMLKKANSLDTHTDTPLDFDVSYNIGTREKTQVCLPKMREGKLDGQYLACWVRQGPCDEENSLKAIDRVDELIRHIYRQVEMNGEQCAIARTPDDLSRLKTEGKKAFYIGIENGYGIGKDLKNITRFHDAGVTYITLCHTRNNDICDSSSDTTARWNGLSPYGRKVVKEMNRLGIMIDLSHAAESTFWDVLKYSKAPVIASHSSASAIYRHDRNLTDEQLRALAAHGGVAQACLVDEFLNPDAKKTNLTDFMKHLLHMVEVAGIDHVGIGSDFDGGGGVKGCNGDNDFINITVRLLEHGFTETDIAKIWGGNFLRVMKQVQTK